MSSKLFLVAMGLFSLSTFAKEKIVYGLDNRVDIKNVHNQKIKELAKSVAGRVAVSSYEMSRKRPFAKIRRVLTLSHPRSMNVCETERFANQPTIVDCTGFLVAPDLLVTAGHCATAMFKEARDEKTFECERNDWVFDYQIDKKGPLNLRKIPKENIYSCKKVVYARYEELDDFAIIQLDRKVIGRKPLKLAAKKVKSKQGIFVLGHPTGLPLKYADSANVFGVFDNFFSTNLDTFGGNSGSPVFNQETLEVEGILVRGDTDYVVAFKDDGTHCMKVNRCNGSRMNCIEDDPNITGEHVSLISKVVEKLEQ
ncbi:MAG: hypothetical protein CME66_07530 [Halobacteriovoraceae bacterium]|jgi:V8-like Glu-specific endopeptidase|nr:hypothetical protein [Halobacteriovoraceae bacterium]|tara:strand:- start:290 stop:1222 length:933 start_codon:yes stop_codon:yes gene_type:complete